MNLKNETRAEQPVCVCVCVCVYGLCVVEGELGMILRKSKTV